MVVYFSTPSNDTVTSGHRWVIEVFVEGRGRRLNKALQSYNTSERSESPRPAE